MHWSSSLKRERQRYVIAWAILVLGFVYVILHLTLKVTTGFNQIIHLLAGTVRPAQYLHKTLEEIEAAKRTDPAARTAWKLLTNARFDK
jgi:hypothetical protein